MDSNSEPRAFYEDKTYVSYVIDAQSLTPLKQEDATVYISKLSSQEQSNLVTVFPD
jgi:hypothetical protein